MKRNVTNLLILLLALAGIAILAYPFASFWISRNDQSYVIQNYDDSLAKLTAEQRKAEWERAKAYNATLSDSILQDAFASDGTDMGEEYRSLLDPNGSGVMSYIEIPKIKVELPIFHGTSPETLEKGIGHLEGSALPVGGKGTHAILNGHTGLNTAKLFTDLIELTKGDEFYLHTMDQVLAYRVDQILVIEPDQVEVLMPVEGKDYVTLVTCTPYGINSHRLLVRGERVAYTPEEIEQKIEDTGSVLSKETKMLCIGLSLLVLLILTALIIRWAKRRRRR